MKIRVFSKKEQRCVVETNRIDLSLDFAHQTFSLSGAPVGVNVLCSAKPSSVVFGHTEATLVFDTLSEAKEFAKALQSASELVHDLCFRALD
jgi:hypothetical protein